MLEILQEVQDLGLDRHIQCGDGLVADDKPGIEGQGSRDPDPLPLPTRELMRVPRAMLR